jgi:hypothetical protein
MAVPGCLKPSIVSARQLIAILPASCTLGTWDSQDIKFSIQYLDTKRT